MPRLGRSPSRALQPVTHQHQRRPLTRYGPALLSFNHLNLCPLQGLGQTTIPLAEEGIKVPGDFSGDLVLHLPEGGHGPPSPRPNRQPGQTQGGPIISGGNFTWGEATKNGTRIPLTQSISFNVSNMARRMEEVRRRLGNRPIIVTSWYRPPAVNAAVGGVPNSTHLNGYAVDFTVSGLSARSTQRILDPWWPGGLGYGPNFTHLDNRGYRVRWNYS